MSDADSTPTEPPPAEPPEPSNSEIMASLQLLNQNVQTLLTVCKHTADSQTKVVTAINQHGESINTLASAMRQVGHDLAQAGDRAMGIRRISGDGNGSSQ